MIDRYNADVISRLARVDLNEAVKKVNRKKQVKAAIQKQQMAANMTMTGQRAEFLNLTPDKPDIMGVGR
jgi:hypothetical protein